MEKKIKLLNALRIVWLALGAALAIYVAVFYKKSAYVPAFVFLGVYLAIELPLRKLEKQRQQMNEATVEPIVEENEAEE